MIKQDIIHSFRKLQKDKVFSFITVAGLAIGIAASLFISAYVFYEFSYDKFWKDSDRIYRINCERYHEGILQSRSACASQLLGEALKIEVPEIESYGFLRKDVVTLYAGENQIKDINWFVSDTFACEVLKKKIVYGSLENPFPDAFGAVLSESTARKLFGNVNPIGKRFKVNEGWEYHVTAVFKDIPDNSHLKIDVLINMASYRYYIRNFNYTTRIIENLVPADSIPSLSITARNLWNRSTSYNYIKLRKGVSPEIVEEKIPAVIDKYAGFLKDIGVTLKCELQPVSEIHLNSDVERELKVSGDKKAVVGLAIVAFLILCIAWINFVNLTMVKAVERSKAIGVRKVVGAKSNNLIRKFIIETIIYNILSVVIALLLIVIFHDWFSNVTGIHGVGRLGWQYFAISGLVIIIGSFLSGLYPALVMSSLNPVSLFQGLKAKTTKSVDFKKLMVIFQFVASIILLIGTMVVYKQINFMNSQELGVNIEQKLITSTPMSSIRRPDLQSKLLTYKSEVEKLDGVELFTSSSSVPGREIEFLFSNVKLPEDKNRGDIISRMNVGPDFFKTYDIKLISGELFTHPDLTKETVILNESASKQLNFINPNDAIGQFILIRNRKYKVIGVVGDHHHESLKKNIGSIIYNCRHVWFRSVGYYTIKLNTKNVRSTISEIKQVWDKIYKSDNFVYFFLNESFNEQYKEEERFAKLSILFSVLAILIACLGLLGLAAFTAEQRTKEIGVRKVNGAKIKEILFLFNADFIKSVLIAFIIASPIAYLVMIKWLQNFAYKTTLSWWIFAASGLLTALIAVTTVSWQTIKTVRRNPVEALRYE